MAVTPPAPGGGAAGAIGTGRSRAGPTDAVTDAVGWTGKSGSAEPEGESAGTRRPPQEVRRQGVGRVAAARARHSKGCTVKEFAQDSEKRLDLISVFVRIQLRAIEKGER